MKLTGKAMASHSTSIAKTQKTNQLAAIRLDDRKCACSCARPRSNAWSDEGSNTDSSANIRYCSEQVSIFRALGVACPKILERKIRVVWVQKEGWFWHHANAPSLFLAQIHLYYKESIQRAKPRKEDTAMMEKEEFKVYITYIVENCSPGLLVGSPRRKVWAETLSCFDSVFDFERVSQSFMPILGPRVWTNWQTLANGLPKRGALAITCNHDFSLSDCALGWECFFGTCICLRAISPGDRKTAGRMKLEKLLWLYPTFTSSSSASTLAFAFLCQDQRHGTFGEMAANTAPFKRALMGMEDVHGCTSCSAAKSRIGSHMHLLLSFWLFMLSNLEPLPSDLLCQDLVSVKYLRKISMVCSFCSQDSHRMLLECFETKTVALLRNQILRFHQSGWQAECDSLVGSEIQCLGQEPNTCGQYTNRYGSKTSVCHYCKRLIRNSWDLLRGSQPKRKWTFWWWPCSKGVLFPPPGLNCVFKVGNYLTLTRSWT